MSHQLYSQSSLHVFLVLPNMQTAVHQGVVNISATGIYKSLNVIHPLRSAPEHQKETNEYNKDKNILWCGPMNKIYSISGGFDTVDSYFGYPRARKVLNTERVGSMMKSRARKKSLRANEIGYARKE